MRTSYITARRVIQFATGFARAANLKRQQKGTKITKGFCEFCACCGQRGL
jgi:hypothetical protein